jgi:hypothetical protein
MLDDRYFLGTWWWIKRTLEFTIRLLDEGTIIICNTYSKIDTVLFEIVEGFKTWLQLKDV